MLAGNRATTRRRRSFERQRFGLKSLRLYNVIIIRLERRCRRLYYRRLTVVAAAVGEREFLNGIYRARGLSHVTTIRISGTRIRSARVRAREIIFPVPLLSVHARRDENRRYISRITCVKTWRVANKKAERPKEEKDRRRGGEHDRRSKEFAVYFASRPS